MSISLPRRALHITSEAVSTRTSRSLRPTVAPPSQLLESLTARIRSLSAPSSILSFPKQLPQQHENASQITSPITLIALTSAVSFICSIDRAAMSVAILPMSTAFDWDDGAKGAISSSFFAGYMLTNLCGGYLATRFNPKVVLAGGVFFWSLFTLCTPEAASSGSLMTLLAVRSMMGVGEGVSYPSIQNIVRESVPATARTRALSFIYSGHQLGTIASYIAAPILISQLGWESVFIVFGSLGFVWLLGWGPLVHGDKAGSGKQLKQGVQGTDTAVATSKAPTNTTLCIKDVPWMEFAKSKAFWAIVAAQVSVGIGSCLSFSWLPTYYHEVYHVDVADSAAFCLVPFMATVVATNAAGYCADTMINRGVLTKTQTRKLMQMVASLGPAACLLRLAMCGNDGSVGSVTDAVCMVTAWLALGGFSAAGYGSNHQDISSKWAGVMFGLSNGLASIAGSASIFATGLVLHQTHDWGLIFTAAAVMYIVGAGIYFTWASAEQTFE